MHKNFLIHPYLGVFTRAYGHILTRSRKPRPDIPPSLTLPLPMREEVLAATQWRHADTQHQFPPKSLRGLATQGAAKAWEALGAAVPQCGSRTTGAALSEMIAVGAVQIFCLRLDWLFSPDATAAEINAKLCGDA